MIYGFDRISYSASITLLRHSGYANLDLNSPSEELSASVSPSSELLSSMVFLPFTILRSFRS